MALRDCGMASSRAKSVAGAGAESQVGQLERQARRSSDRPAKTAGAKAGERERLRELQALDLLDTPTEERFDAVARLAARTFRAPIALVSLVDEDRQWFKACIGLEVRATGREVSFCSHAIEHPEEVMVVEDALKDPRFRDNGLVTGPPHIRFYMGAPIRGPGGSVLGTVCVIDRNPRSVEPGDTAIMHSLARLVEFEIVLRLLAHEQPLDLVSVGDVQALDAMSRMRFWEMSRDMLCIASTEGYFLDVNARFMQVLGRDRNQLLETPFIEFVHPDDRDATLKEVAKLQSGLPTISFSNRYRCQDGSYKWLEWTATPLGDTLYAVARDVTQRRKMDEDMRQIQGALERSNQALEEYAYLVSHDMREPLRAVISRLDAIMEDHADALPENAVHHLDRATRAGTRLTHMIDNLMEYARLGKAEPPGDAVTDLGQVMDNIRSSLNPLLEERGAKLIVGDMPVLPGDPARIEMLMQNLVKNGIQSVSDGAPRIKIEAAEEAGWWNIDVSDNGRGIPEVNRENIFRMFQQIHPEQLGGSAGIGLAVCRRVVEQHGGTIAVLRSDPATGTTMRVRLPSEVVV